MRNIIGMLYPSETMDQSISSEALDFTAVPNHCPFRLHFLSHLSQNKEKGGGVGNTKYRVDLRRETV
jgi:hypothetical protein